MKNLSKVLAVVLAFAMALSMVSFAAYSDVQAGDDCEEAVTVLSALGILSGYEDGTFKPEATITRAEFASVVIRMLGYGDIAGGGSVIFNDVPADHWANGVIALAASQGIIAGYGDGNFGPNDPVNYEQAIAMVIRALGYTPMADANGGYPGGYQVVASGKGILAGTSGAPGVPANRGTVAQFVYNSLTVPMMEQTSFGTDTQYQPVKKLILNNHGVTKLEGVVDGTVASGGTTKAGQIKVIYHNQISAPTNNAALAVKYSAFPTNNAYPVIPSATATIKADSDVEAMAKDLIDVASVMYVKNAETSDAKLLCIMKDGDKNKTVEFKNEDLKVVPADKDCIIEVYTDEDAGEYEEYEIDINKVYVNGRTLAIEDGVGATEAGQTITDIDTVITTYLDGSDTTAVDVKLLANDASEEDVYKVAYITVWEDAVVESISAKNWKVYTDNGTYKLDETDTKAQNFTIYKDGEIASFEDIEENDVLSVAGYRAGDTLKYGDVYITSEKVEGKVTGTAGAYTVFVDGTEYKTNGLSVALGNSYTFYKNARGLLVGLDRTETAANLKFGFVSYIYDDVNFGDATVRMLTSDGVWTNLEVASKFTTLVSGTPAKVTESTISTWNTEVDGMAGSDAFEGSKWAVNNVAAYELNDAGEIDVLYLAAASGEDFNEDNLPSRNGISTGSTKDRTYVSSTNMIGGFDVADSTVIFNLANGFTLGEDDAIDEDDVTVAAVSTLVDREVYNISKAYNADEDTNVWSVLVGYEFTTGVDWAADFFVVSADPMTTTNEEGDSGVMITGVENGETKTLFINVDDLDTTDVQKVAYVAYNDDVKTGNTSNLVASTFNATNLAASIARGDVFIYGLNAKGEAAKAIRLLAASDVVNVAGDDADYTYLTNDVVLAAAGFTSETSNVIGNFTAGNTTYDFIFGYVKDRTGNKLTLIGADDTTENIYNLASDKIGAKYDAFTANGKVYEAVAGDIGLDPMYGETGESNDGDFIFARVSNGVTIDEFVVIANKD